MGNSNNNRYNNSLRAIRASSHSRLAMDSSLRPSRVAFSNLNRMAFSNLNLRGFNRPSQLGISSPRRTKSLSKPHSRLSNRRTKLPSRVNRSHQVSQPLKLYDHR